MAKTASDKFDAMPEQVRQALREDGWVDSEGQLIQVPDHMIMSGRDMTGQEVFHIWFMWLNMIGYADEFDPEALDTMIYETVLKIKEALDG